MARTLLSLMPGTYRSRSHGAGLLTLASRALIQAATRSRSADGLDLPKLDPLLCFHSLGLFSVRLVAAFTATPLATLAMSAHCPPSRWSSAYRSAPDLVIHPWTTLPFEIFNLPSSPTEAEHSSEVRRTRRPATTAEQSRVFAGVVPPARARASLRLASYCGETRMSQLPVTAVDSLREGCVGE
jgi:hypothetical protein